jgi:hypothetical protein
VEEIKALFNVFYIKNPFKVRFGGFFTEGCLKLNYIHILELVEIYETLNFENDGTLAS